MENFKTDDDLKSFFDTLKHVPEEPMSLDMVREKVQSIKKFKTIKNNIMNISIFLSIGGLLTYLGFYSGSGINTVADFGQVQSVSRQDESSQHVATEIEYPVMPEVKNIQEEHPVFEQTDEPAVLPIVNKIPLPAAFPSDPALADDDTTLYKNSSVHYAKINTGISQAIPDTLHAETPGSPLPFPVVRLSVDQLEKLGIYSGSNGIFYQSVRFIREPYYFFYLPAISSVSCTSPNAIYKDYYPVLVTDRYFHVVHETSYHSADASLAEQKAMTKDLIPVIAYANEKPKPVFYEEQIFWFKRTDAFMELLPSEVRQAVLENKYVWDLTKDSIPFTKEIEQAERSIRLAAATVKESDYIDFDTTHAVKADAQLRDKLGFVKNEPFINYHYKSVRFSHHYNIDPKTGDTSLNINRETGKNKHIEFAQKKNSIPLFRFEHMLPFTASSISEVGAGGHTYTRYQNYMLNRHALIPVVIRTPQSSDACVYWYYPTPNFMKLLNSEQYKSARSYLEHHKKDSLILSRFEVKANYPSLASFEDLRKTDHPAFSFTKVELDSATLRKLGIVIYDKSVSYFFRSGNSFVETNFSKKGTQIHFDRKPGMNYATGTALIITDDLGRYPRMSLDSHNVNTIDFNTLVPVYAKTNDEYTNTDKLQRSWRPDVIFWFRPDSAFLSMLPGQVATTMASDVKAIQAGSKSGSCTYFDVCRSMTPTITDYRFFPNPAKHELHISLKTQAETGINVRIFDMSGKQVLQDLAFATSGNELNATLDITALTPGIYNLLLNSENGDRLISRIIVME